MVKVISSIDDFNLVKIPKVKSFYTTCIDENNKFGRKLTDTVGNIYEIDKYEEDFLFNVMTQFEKNSLMHKFCGFVISYKGKPVYAETCQLPYIILNKELFFMYCGNFHVNNRGRNFLQDLNMNNFDDNFIC